MSSASRPRKGAVPPAADDLPRLAELAAAAVRGAREPGVGARCGPARRRASRPTSRALAAELAAPDHHVLVGTLDGTVLGYGVAHVEVLRDGGRLGVVDDLYTEPGVPGARPR